MILKRQIIVELGVPGELARRFTDLRISGKVERSSASGPNVASVTLINPGRDTIALAQQQGAVVRVLAGYDVPRLLFVGDVNKGGATVEQQGPDRVLTLEAQDGGRALREARVERSFSGEVSAEQVLGVVADAMGLPLGAVNLPDTLRWPRGLSLSGAARDVLNEVTESLGVRWSVQDGALQVLADSEDTGELAVRVAAETGNLIGSPKPLDNGLEVTALLDGRIRPGRRFVVASREFNGVYRAREVTHSFDSGWDNSFYTIVTGIEA